MSMKILEMINNIKTMIQMQILEPGLDWTPTGHDRHFVKNVTIYILQVITTNLRIGISYLSENH